MSLVGMSFRMTPAEGDGFDIVLSSCDVARHGAPEDGKEAIGRTPFSLLFHAPDRQLVGQQICTLHHERLGELALFLVPLGPDDLGMRYEAVVS